MEIRETATGSLITQGPQCRNPVPLLLSRRPTEAMTTIVVPKPLMDPKGIRRPNQSSFI